MQAIILVLCLAALPVTEEDPRDAEIRQLRAEVTLLRATVKRQQKKIRELAKPTSRPATQPSAERQQQISALEKQIAAYQPRKTEIRNILVQFRSKAYIENSLRQQRRWGDIRKKTTTIKVASGARRKGTKTASRVDETRRPSFFGEASKGVYGSVDGDKPQITKVSKMNYDFKYSAKQIAAERARLTKPYGDELREMNEKIKPLQAKLLKLRMGR